MLLLQACACFFLTGQFTANRPSDAEFWVWGGGGGRGGRHTGTEVIGAYRNLHKNVNGDHSIIAFACYFKG